MTKKIQRVLTVLLFLSVLATWGYVCFLVKDTVLACHDSVMEYINARVNGWKQGYVYGMEYSLARGKVGLIFPAVIMFRFFVNGTGNYSAIWLLQYIPVFANIALLSVFFAKKVHKTAGLLFALFFFSFLQLDIWHCLITCYPLDFMYGLFLMISGLWLFLDYQEKKGEHNNTARLVVSLILFYESMQVYEAFIVASLVYAVIAFCYSIRRKGGIKYFVKALIPHFIVAVVYIGILAYLRAHPVVDIAVSSIDSHVDVKRAARTCFEFSTGMFPLKDLRVISSVKELFLHPVHSKKLFAFTAASGFGALVAALLAYNEFRYYSKEARKSTCLKLLATTASGCLIALSYPLPHSLIPSYQDWVIQGAAGGYLPTTISYFGWSVAIVSVMLIVICLLSAIKYVNIPLAVLMCVFFAVGAFITANINMVFPQVESFAGEYMSVKFRTLYDIFRDDYLDQEGIVYFYVPAYNGVHSNIETDETLVEVEAGYDVELINNIEGNEMLLQQNESRYIRYDADAHAALILDIEDYTAEEASWMTRSVYIFACNECDYDVLLTRAEGDQYVVRVHANAGEITLVEDDELVSAEVIDTYYA